MLDANAKRILSGLSAGDLVLDIGGWACPFNRANYILDAEPYETRGFYERAGVGADHQGGETEFFSKETWVQRDICDREPFPFPDRYFDFVICSQTLEDIRDPLWVCSEMIRVGKRGYIEVPSRAAESSRGWEHPRIAGLSHHRWLIEIQDETITFLQKYHGIHSHWRLSLPRSYLAKLPLESQVRWLFWEGAFAFKEKVLHGAEQLLRELEGFVAQERPYPQWALSADAAARAIGRVARRGIAFLGGRARRAFR